MYLLHDNERVVKWKSSIKKGNSNPVYQESSELDLADLEEGKTELHVLVMNYELLGRNSEVGRVKFGEDVSDCTTGQTHWNKSLDSPNRSVTAWHPIFPSPPKQLLGPMRSRSSSRERSRSWSPVAKLKKAIGMQVLH